MIELRDKDKLQISQIARSTLPLGAQVWAYGSRVKGNCHDASDLDLVISTSIVNPLPLDNLVTFKHALQDSTIPILIQVLDWHHIPESFKSNILKRYEVLIDVDAPPEHGQDER